jgi:hypothetical protein
MKKKEINRILGFVTAAASVLSMNACGTTFPQNLQSSAFQMDCSGSACFAADPEAHVALLSPNIVSMRSVNDYLAQCGEQARMVHHEIQNCRAVTVITVPLDYADIPTAPHTSGRGFYDLAN